MFKLQALNLSSQTFLSYCLIRSSNCFKYLYLWSCLWYCARSFCLPVSELQMKFSRLLECEQCFIFLYSRSRARVRGEQRSRVERERRKNIFPLSILISPPVYHLFALFYFFTSNQRPSGCSYEASSVFLLLACRENSIVHRLNYWVWSTPLMNGERSIYVALTSLASPNEELNVLSTAAEQDKKHCNSQWGTKLIYQSMINEPREKVRTIPRGIWGRYRKKARFLMVVAGHWIFTRCENLSCYF